MLVVLLEVVQSLRQDWQSDQNVAESRNWRGQRSYRPKPSPFEEFLSLYAPLFGPMVRQSYNLPQLNMKTRYKPTYRKPTKKKKKIPSYHKPSYHHHKPSYHQPKPSHHQPSYEDSAPTYQSKPTYHTLEPSPHPPPTPTYQESVSEDEYVSPAASVVSSYSESQDEYGSPKAPVASYVESEEYGSPQAPAAETYEEPEKAEDSAPAPYYIPSYTEEYGSYQPAAEVYKNLGKTDEEYGSPQAPATSYGEPEEYGSPEPPVASYSQPEEYGSPQAPATSNADPEEEEEEYGSPQPELEETEYSSPPALATSYSQYAASSTKPVEPISAYNEPEVVFGQEWTPLEGCHTCSAEEAQEEYGSQETAMEARFEEQEEYNSPEPGVESYEEPLGEEENGYSTLLQSYKNSKKPATVHTPIAGSPPPPSAPAQPLYGVFVSQEQAVFDRTQRRFSSYPPFPVATPPYTTPSNL